MSPDEAARRLQGDRPREQGARAAPPPSDKLRVVVNAGDPVLVSGDDAVDTIAIDEPVPSSTSVNVVANGRAFSPVLAHGGWRTAGRTYPDRVVVRVNPDRELDLLINSSDAEIRDVRCPLNAHVNAGGIRISGRFDRGESQLIGNAGDIELELLEGSDVRVEVGPRAAIAGDPPTKGSQTGDREWTLGDGRAYFYIDGNFGSVRLTTP
jgi:hypothetical protein